MAKTKSHNRLFEKDNIIIDIPSDCYSEDRVELWAKNVLHLAKDKDRWCLLSIPDYSITVTPSGADLLAKKYEIFRENGCMLIALHSENTPSKILLHALLSKSLKEPFIKSDRSVEYLCSLLQDAMGGESVLNDTES
ncbi:hypothetical protein KUL152_19260 [Tenacibaculum sp. KUL152]|nr:hypothetical protein KUL152_19260 [Tenacibaculum sp. KUL152]